MNQALSFVQAARAPSADANALSSDQMLSELLALHEEMVIQLRRARPDGVGTTDLLRSMIDQHENAATLLRAKLVCPEALPTPLTPQIQHE
jgi:hypothetical protein